MNARRKWAARLAALYFALASACLVSPIYPWLGNRVEPRVFGLPFSLSSILAVILANFVVLNVLYRLELIDARELELEPEAQGEGDEPS